MEPQFKSSFIPKKPVVSVQSTTLPVVRETNIFSLIATTFFIVALLISGGLFAYEKLLYGQITDSQTALEEARAAFQADKIQDLINSNSKIASAKTLLTKHVAVSKLLLLMQELTVSKVQFLELSYMNKTGTATMKIMAQAQSYNALAVQSSVFSQNEFIRNPNFSAFQPQETGLIVASFSSVIDTNLVSYERAISSLSLNNTTQ